MILRDQAKVEKTCFRREEIFKNDAK